MKIRAFSRPVLALLLLLSALAPTLAQTTRDLYEKREFPIPMRDGRTLYTAVYLPKNKPGKHPILLERTPYGAGPYGLDRYRGGFRGSKKLQDYGYIFAYQDVRGLGQSQGTFVNTRPQVLTAKRGQDIDESTDTYDTVDYLVKNLPESNGNVGLWGISYPGFYAAVGAIESHPALKAVSPQAPVADWFIGDDFHHNGAMMLMDAIRFGRFGQSPGRGSGGGGFVPDQTDDAYQFFLELGTLGTITQKYFADTDGLWKFFVEHEAYDDYWQARSLPDKLKKVRCAVLTVGGWYDAEDCWGALNVYGYAERQNPGIVNALVMGPWSHGQWAGSDGTRLGEAEFGSNTSTYFQEKIELPFFEKYLRGVEGGRIPEAQVFETGTNRWRQFSAWPPREAKEQALYFAAESGLSLTPPSTAGSDHYVSDPANPVPYQGGKIVTRTTTYPTADQRFAASRPDVLRYQSAPLEQPLTIAGPITADIVLSTTATDLDVIVKVIDVLPETGVQRLVRAEVLRGKFRNSFTNPTPITPGVATPFRFTLPDVLHTFGKGHRVMVQVQSTWFPLVDRNPQQFMNLYEAKPGDFKKADVTLHFGGTTPSAIRFPSLR